MHGWRHTAIHSERLSGEWTFKMDHRFSDIEKFQVCVIQLPAFHMYVFRIVKCDIIAECLCVYCWTDEMEKVLIANEECGIQRARVLKAESANEIQVNTPKERESTVETSRRTKEIILAYFLSVSISGILLRHWRNTHLSTRQHFPLAIIL